MIKVHTRFQDCQAVKRIIRGHTSKMVPVHQIKSKVLMRNASRSLSAQIQSPKIEVPISTATTSHHTAPPQPLPNPTTSLPNPFLPHPISSNPAPTLPFPPQSYYQPTTTLNLPISYTTDPTPAAPTQPPPQPPYTPPSSPPIKQTPPILPHPFSTRIQKSYCSIWNSCCFS